jgi:hypothetical protein
MHDFIIDSSISFFYNLYLYRLYFWYIDVNKKKIWYKIYFNGKLKIILIASEIIFLCQFNIVI